MKRIVIAIAMSTLLAGCGGGGEIASDERGKFRTEGFFKTENKIRVSLVEKAPKSGMGEGREFKIDADETPGGISGYLADELLDCRIVVRIDRFKDTKKEPEITDCKRTSQSAR